MRTVSGTNVLPQGMKRSAELLSLGSSLRLLAIVVIILLSLGVGVLAVREWVESGLAQQGLRSDGQLVYGFGLLMLLTVGYLIGKGWTTTKYQQNLISELLEEEAVARALRMDPILGYHHPELCREILLRHANYAARSRSTLSLVELTVADFWMFSAQDRHQALAGEFYQELRRNCRGLDFWVRWGPNSFLLVLLDVTGEETAGVVYRLRSRLLRWWNEHSQAATPTSLEWRYRTAGSLGSSGDVLQEARSLMQHDQFIPTPIADIWHTRGEPLPRMESELAGTGGARR